MEGLFSNVIYHKESNLCICKICGVVLQKDFKRHFSLHLVNFDKKDLMFLQSIEQSTYLNAHKENLIKKSLPFLKIFDGYECNKCNIKLINLLNIKKHIKKAHSQTDTFSLKKMQTLSSRLNNFFLC